MMFPSLRGGNDNPGQREGFLGEVDDVLAATDHLAKLPSVDPEQISLGGHSTGGTLVMLVAASSNRYRAVFSPGPLAAATHYGGQFVSCDARNRQEMRLRSPREWLHCVERPLYVFEAAGTQGNWTDSIEPMASENSNPQVRFLPVPGVNHFSVIAPVTELLARQIVADEVRVTTEDVKQMRYTVTTDSPPSKVGTDIAGGRTSVSAPLGAHPQTPAPMGSEHIWTGNTNPLTSTQPAERDQSQPRGSADLFVRPLGVHPKNPAPLGSPTACGMETPLVIQPQVTAG